MMFPQIRCYHPGAPVQPYVFYMLAKGENAGKPSLKPWANSFIIICANQKQFDFFYWLAYGLSKANRFKLRLKGSVIPFLSLQDVRDTIREVTPAVFPDWEKFQELISSLNNMDKLKESLTQQVKATEQLQQCLIAKYFVGLK